MRYRAKEYTIMPGRWLNPILEAGFGLSVAILLVALMPVAWMPARLVFCLFFLLVFAVTIRHQTAIAYGTGLCAAISYVLLLLQRPEQQVAAAFPHLMVEAFLLLIGGILMSDLSRLQRKRLALLEQQEASNNEALQTTTRRYQKALRVNEELERQIMEQPASLATISNKIVQLWKLDLTARYDAILDILVSAVGVEACALYLSYDEQFRLCGSYPVQEEPHPLFLESSDPLIERVIQTRRICTIRESLLEGEALPEQASLIVGPLLDREEQLIGVIVIEKMPLLKFTPGTVDLLASLFALVALSLQNEPELTEKDLLEGADDDDMTDHYNVALKLPFPINK